MRNAEMIVWAVLSACRVLRAQTPAQDLLSRALQHPEDEEIVGQVPPAYHDAKDPAVLARLRELFEKVTQKRPRRDLAVLMFVTLGQRDDLYFNVLAKYALEAVTSDAPLPYFLDSEGNSIQGPPPVAFTNWCGAHQLKPDSCWTTVAEHGPDVMYLSLLKDRRAIPIFRQGLKSDNDAVVWMSVGALGSLNDGDSIPLIKAAVPRFRPKQRSLIASALAEFDDPRVGPLLDEFVKDPKWRQELDDKIRKRHAEPARQ